MSIDSTDAPGSELAALRAQRVAWIAAREAARPPVAAGFTRLEGEELDRNFAALTVLSQRRLTDGDPEKKVRLIIRKHYNEAHGIFRDLFHLNITNHPVPDDWEDDQTIPVVISERRQHGHEKLKRDYFDIPTVPPHLILGPDDMPVSSIKGDLGHQNRMGVADIKIKLGYLYQDEKPKAAEKADEPLKAG